MHDPTYNLVLGCDTKWVRLWAGWDTFEPNAPSGGAHAWDQAALTNLDQQIARANAAGLGVILTLWRFPQWSNGTAGISDNWQALDNQRTQPEDRLYRGHAWSELKSLKFKWPNDLSTTGPWAAWLRFMATRYHTYFPSNPLNARVTAVEFVNEPNNQCWPQQAASGTGDAYDQGLVALNCYLYQMFYTARPIQDSLGGWPRMVGPAFATPETSLGNPKTDRLTTAHDRATDDLLNSLSGSNWPATSAFVWSQHNYADVVKGRTYAHDIAFNYLTGRWAGWPIGDPAHPRMWLTEGGAPYPEVAAALGVELNANTLTLVSLEQGSMLGDALARLGNDTDGRAIEMFTQYLVYSDPCYDSGLCNPLVPHGMCTTVEAYDGASRPAYGQWKTRFPGKV